ALERQAQIQHARADADPGRRRVRSRGVAGGTRPARCWLRCSESRADGTRERVVHEGRRKCAAPPGEPAGQARQRLLDRRHGRAVSTSRLARGPEVPAMAVRRAVRRVAAEALEAVAADLRLPRLRVRWFKGARGCWDDGDAALYALSSKIRPGLLGAAVSGV